MAIPTEPIGSIPRPAQLIDAGHDLAAGQIAAGEYARLADAAVRETIEQLEATGSTVITDGEQSKPSFATYPLAGSGAESSSSKPRSASTSAARGVEACRRDVDAIIWPGAASLESIRRARARRAWSASGTRRAEVSDERCGSHLPVCHSVPRLPGFGALAGGHRRVAAWVWNGRSGPPGSRHVHKQVPGRLPEGPWWTHDRAARVSVAMRVAQADV